jgi:hypothetical protein
VSEALDPQRRDFLKTASAAAATGLTSSFFVHASDKAGVKPAVIGSGEFTYECHHNWGEVPDHIRWHATHGVAIDAAGLIYITHRAPFNSNIDTAAIFEPSGKFVRSFGKQWNFGGHGIDIRRDGNEEFQSLDRVWSRKPRSGAKKSGSCRILQNQVFTKPRRNTARRTSPLLRTEASTSPMDTV